VPKFKFKFDALFLIS